MSNPFKEKLSKFAQEEQKRKEKERKEQERTSLKILSLIQKGRNLTKEDEKELLEIDENMISKEMYHMMYYVLKAYIETGKVPEIESYIENYKGREQISLQQLEFTGKGKEIKQSNEEEKGDVPR